MWSFNSSAREGWKVGGIDGDGNGHQQEAEAVRRRVQADVGCSDGKAEQHHIERQNQGSEHTRRGEKTGFCQQPSAQGPGCAGPVPAEQRQSENKSRDDFAPELRHWNPSHVVRVMDKRGDSCDVQNLGQHLRDGPDGSLEAPVDPAGIGGERNEGQPRQEHDEPHLRGLRQQKADTGKHAKRRRGKYQPDAQHPGVNGRGATGVSCYLAAADLVEAAVDSERQIASDRRREAENAERFRPETAREERRCDKRHKASRHFTAGKRGDVQDDRGWTQGAHPGEHLRHGWWNLDPDRGVIAGAPATP